MLFAEHKLIFYTHKIFYNISEMTHVLLDALTAHQRRSWQTLLEICLRTIPAAICFWQSYVHGAGS